MKHKLLPLLLILLCACTSKSTTLTVNDPLSYSVRIKDNAEFILVKEGTSIEDFNDILLDNLDIDTNADTYDVDWYGEAYSTLTREDLQTLIDKYGLNGSKISESKFLTSNDKTRQIVYEHLGDTDYEKEVTLNHDSFRPIELIIDFTKDDTTETYYKQILLCVARDNEYNLITTNSITDVQGVYDVVYKDYYGSSDYLNTDNIIPGTYVSIGAQAILDDGYASNFRMKYSND